MQSLPGRTGARWVGQRPGSNVVFRLVNTCKILSLMECIRLCSVSRDSWDFAGLFSNGTTFSQTGVCRECRAPNVVSPDHMRCSPCSPGEQPNADRNDCLAVQRPVNPNRCATIFMPISEQACVEFCGCVV